MSIRTVVVEAAGLTRRLVSHPAVAVAWSAASALEQMTVGDLAAHLTRSITTAADYLNRPDPGIREDMTDAPGYFLSFGDLSGPDGPDLDTDLHAGIRRRAAAQAAGGPDEVLAAWDRAHDELTARLAIEPHTRAVEVFAGKRMMLDQYLVTRLIEMTIHADDLAVSLGVPSPAFSRSVWDPVVACLVEVGRRRHGDVAVVRAMTRTERDMVDALRIL